MKFQIYQDNFKEWRWRLVARNGRTIADSGEGYETRNGVLRSIKSVRKCESAPVKEVDDASGN